MKRTITTALAATALGLGGLVAASAPASAQQPVRCPTHAGAFTGSPLAAHDDIKRRGVEFQPKPTGAQAFPSAADRAALDKIVPGGGLPAIGEPAGEQ